MSYFCFASRLSGKTLINLGSEEEGSFIVGCAGGKSTRIQLSISRVELESDHDLFSLSVNGLQGGHSGAEIHKQRANANKVLIRALDDIRQVVPIQWSLFRGGTAHNAIPRIAGAIFSCPGDLTALCRQRFASFARQRQSEYGRSDPALKLRLANLRKIKLEALSIRRPQPRSLIS